MKENKHTMEDLRLMQALPLDIKIAMTKRRIRDWINYYGEDGVYVSFSGGKDSTVLLNMVREDYPKVPAVFVDTGLEYPEIREFVKTFDNVEWLRPKMNFKQVIETYGYPFFSKAIAKRVWEYNNALKKGKDITKTSAYKEFYGLRTFQSKGFGNSTKSFHNKEKWAFLINAPFKMSHKCCDIMKKHPAHNYGLKTKRQPITAQMACESENRLNVWLKNGCNAFDARTPMSNPMSFWTEQDVLLYIKTKNLPICSVYGDIIEDRTGTDEVEGQLTISDMTGFEGCKDFDAKRLPLKTTGCQRTGCMFCGYGCHLEKPGEGRFERMKITHPKQYEFIMKPTSEGGLGYKEIIDWMNEHGNLSIKY